MNNGSNIRRRKRGEGYPRLVVRLIFILPVVLSIYGAERLNTAHFSLVERYILLLVMVLGLYLCVLTHELGHVLAGVAVGFKFVHFSVGSYQLRRQDGRLRLSRVRLKGFSGGLAGLYPTSAENLRFRYAIHIAGGPLADLGFAAASYVAYMSISHRPMWEYFLSFYAIDSFLRLVLNLLPIYYAGFRTDGANLLSALRGNDRDRHRFSHMALVAAIGYGIRPRDWDPSLVRQIPLSNMRGVDILQINLMKCYYAWDNGQIEEAGNYFARVMERKEDYPLANRKALYYEAAYFWARYHGDITQAQEWLSSEGTEILPEQYYPFVVDAAIAFAEGNTDRAIKKAQQAIELLEDTPFPGMAKMMRDDLAQLVAEASQSSKSLLELGAHATGAEFDRSDPTYRQLRHKLGELAIDWRSYEITGGDPRQEEIVKEYHKIIAQLDAMGWDRFLGLDEALPVYLMPRYFQENASDFYLDASGVERKDIER